MTISLEIQGFFDLTICVLNTAIPVENDIAESVKDNLQQGEYLLNMRTRTICSLQDCTAPLYSVIIEATDNCEYTFDNE